MALKRVLEPEVMDTPEEARDYDAMDHAEVNGRFCDDLLAFAPSIRTVLDVGTGTARIPIALCAKKPDVTIVAIDLADHMLAVARENVARAGLGGRIDLRKEDAKNAGFAPASFDAVVSNTILHHIPEPAAMLRELVRLAGKVIFVRDLVRPDSDAAVDALVKKYGGAPGSQEPGAVASWEHQRDLFAASLRAALTLDEIRALVLPLVAPLVAPRGIPKEAVRMTSDRHWTFAYARP